METMIWVEGHKVNDHLSQWVITVENVFIYHMEYNISENKEFSM
jgi:hypothetical protein